MKKAYQIDERRAIEKSRSHLLNDHGAIQMILPLAEIAQKLRNGVGQFLLQSQLQLLTLIMEDEVDWMTGPRYERDAAKEIQRWGREDGSVVLTDRRYRSSARAPAEREGRSRSAAMNCSGETRSSRNGFGTRSHAG